MRDRPEPEHDLRQWAGEAGRTRGNEKLFARGRAVGEGVGDELGHHGLDVGVERSPNAEILEAGAEEGSRGSRGAAVLC